MSARLDLVLVLPKGDAFGARKTLWRNKRRNSTKDDNDAGVFVVNTSETMAGEGEESRESWEG